MHRRMSPVKWPLAGILVLLSASWSDAWTVTHRYTCFTEHAADLHFDSVLNTWNPQTFVGHKYTLRQLTADDRDRIKGRWSALLERHPNANWAFFEFGKPDPMPLAACIEDTGDALAADIVCHPIVDEGRFNKDTRRFELSSLGGYVSQGFWEQLRLENPEAYELLLTQGKAQDPTKPSDLFVEIGRCKPS
jgi:hypothetical protein